MRDKKDHLGRRDWNSDGVTGYTQGANPRGNWINNNMGKVVIFMIVALVIVIASVVIEVMNSRDDEPKPQAEVQREAGN